MNDKMMKQYDVVIIGAGVTGCAAARYLSRYKVHAAVIERAEDVCAAGASKANSAIVHAGFDAPTGSLMAKLNVEGSRVMPRLAKELDFSYMNNGSLVVCMDEADYAKLERLYQNGLKNGVEGLEIVRGERLREIEPAVRREAYAALWAPTGAIICPFGLTIALAENAAANGLAERIAPMLGDVSRIAGRKYDFIAANINRNILTMDMPAYAEALDTGGDLLMSGFLEEDVPVIEARARACGLEPVEVRRRDGWAMVHVKKA